MTPSLDTLRAENDVPAADSTANAKDRDVIGNKSDAQTTTVGTTASIMAYLKVLLSRTGVQTVDSAANTNVFLVIGNKSDAAVSTVGTTASILAYVKGIINLIKSNLKSTTVLHECTYPEVTLTGSGVANTYGAYAQIHAAPGYDIELIGVFVAPSGGTVGNTAAVEIAKGAAAAEVPIATVPFIIRTEGYYFPFPSPILVTDQRLAARTKNEGTSGGANVMAVWRKVS